MLLSIVSPVYKAEKMIDELINRIRDSVSGITEEYEIILVEDGGGDESWQKIRAHHKVDGRVKGIKLSRNFGQHHAITAGLDNCVGDWIVVMDCDLQDRPEEIPALYQQALKGFDIVYAQRKYRNDSFFKRSYSKVFYRIFSWLSGVPHDGTIANFGIYSNKAICAVNELREPLRSFATLIKWVGFNTCAIEVSHAGRLEGKSTYSFKKLLRLALDISLSFSDKPLRMTVSLGALISLSSFFYGMFVLYEYFSGKITTPGFTSLILSIWFLSGLIIFILGVIGLYLGKVFDGIKRRPFYVIDERYD
jgi:polyisoprenyl-phosphate glycosyltransferase